MAQHIVPHKEDQPLAETELSDFVFLQASIAFTDPTFRGVSSLNGAVLSFIQHGALAGQKASSG
ncbi:hypothetical protein HNR65_003249 [Desulfosalsimonas propionicica]|uniref:Uncharacterized protein n=1 Tax=Desulfosalsimonas propionicica TaxID=332175 RepID=A0A7W0CC16_9BACT|nr:hypothetical protein [Desulfosalsimonas propionicica]MBA2882894.1 hypothetical protein [Desulfosalsimonas propionicica]